MDFPDKREQNLDAWLSLTAKVPSGPETVQLPVLSGSMLPSIPPGAILEIQPKNPTHCQVGEVVVFLEGNDRLTAHRIIACFQIGPFGWVLQKGDNNAQGAWIKKSQIRGIVVKVLTEMDGGDESHQKQNNDVFNMSTALASRRKHIRNLALMWPRRIRDFLFRKNGARP